MGFVTAGANGEITKSPLSSFNSLMPKLVNQKVKSLRVPLYISYVAYYSTTRPSLSPGLVTSPTTP
jgi:hypothetical protein